MGGGHLLLVLVFRRLCGRGDGGGVGVVCGLGRVIKLMMESWLLSVVLLLFLFFFFLGWRVALRFSVVCGGVGGIGGGGSGSMRRRVDRGDEGGSGGWGVGEEGVFVMVSGVGGSGLQVGESEGGVGVGCGAGVGLVVSVWAEFLS